MLLHPPFKTTECVIDGTVGQREREREIALDLRGKKEIEHFTELGWR